MNSLMVTLLLLVLMDRYSFLLKKSYFYLIQRSPRQYQYSHHGAEDFVLLLSSITVLGTKKPPPRKGHYHLTQLVTTDSGIRPFQGRYGVRRTSYLTPWSFVTKLGQRLEYYTGSPLLDPRNRRFRSPLLLLMQDHNV